MDDERFEYTVLVNHEEQYSLWPTFKEVPDGWRQVGPVGSKAECIEWLERVWTDTTPLSVRKQLEESKVRRQQNPR